MRSDVIRAAALLRAGELVAFPTETVYGLGADALNSSAVAKIFAVKGRPADHPLIVHLPASARLDDWAREIPPDARRLAEALWPGPLTLILQRQPHVPDAVTGGQDTVGLRVPRHPLALDLLETFGGGVAAPSANRYGRISPTLAQHVVEELGSAVSMVLDGGACEVGIESTIVDLSRGEAVLLRPGLIGAERIARVLGRPAAIDDALEKPAPRVSGSHLAHYAPGTPLRLVRPDRLRDVLNAQRHAGHRCAVIAYSQPALAESPHVWRMLPAESAGYAHDLYSAMRELDSLGMRAIVVELPPEGEAWHAIHDRLMRSAAGSGIAGDDRI